MSDIPIRCFTCGKVLNHLQSIYSELTKSGLEPMKIWYDLGLKRYCCKRMILTHVNIEDKLLRYCKSEYFF